MIIMASAILNILEGVKQQAAESVAKDAEQGKVQNIDLTGGKKPLSHEEIQTTIEQMAGAIMELTARLNAKGDNQ